MTEEELLVTLKDLWTKVRDMRRAQNKFPGPHPGEPSTLDGAGKGDRRRD